MPEEKQVAVEKSPVALGKAVPIEWAVPDGIVTVYANNMVIQYGEHDCYLMFFEGVPPLLVGKTPEQQEAYLSKLDSVTVNCVARIAVPKNLVPSIVKVIQDTLTTISVAETSDSQPAPKG